MWGVCRCFRGTNPAAWAGHQTLHQTSWPCATNTKPQIISPKPAWTGWGEKADWRSAWKGLDSAFTQPIQSPHIVCHQKKRHTMNVHKLQGTKPEHSGRQIPYTKGRQNLRPLGRLYHIFQDRLNIGVPPGGSGARTPPPRGLPQPLGPLWIYCATIWPHERTSHFIMAN